jgi:hypothetical protein
MEGDAFGEAITIYIGLGGDWTLIDRLVVYKSSGSCRHHHCLQDRGLSLAFPCRLLLGETMQAQDDEVCAVVRVLGC